MTDAELVAFAAEFREGLLNGRPPDRMCFVVCGPLAGLLRFHGVHAELVESDGHHWIRLRDGRALDPTIDQFWPKLAPVYLGRPIPSLHKEDTDA